MSASKILLILGAGGNVGSNVASLFGKSGYQVALAARRLTDGKGEEGHLHIKADLSNPASVEKVFERVTSTFGPPNVVVYNAAAASFVPKDDPLNLSVEALNKDLAVTTISALAAAKQAVKAFDDLPADSTKVFIYTGNFLNKTALPAVLSLGMGKSASAHLMEVAAKAYGSKGYWYGESGRVCCAMLTRLQLLLR